MTVSQVFDAVAGEYDAPRRRLIPCFDLFYGTAATIAAGRLAEVAATGRKPTLLDLGAGTGLLAGSIVGVAGGIGAGGGATVAGDVLGGEVLGGAALGGEVVVTLLDGAPTMLDVAARRLAAHGVAHRVIVADLRDELPPGPFDAVVSALAIHHLDDDGKRDLYARAYRVLAPGGVFVNAEQIAATTPALDRRNHEIWLDQCRANGATEQELAGALQRMAYDLPATVDAQLGWLREAGFTDVDCYAKAWRFAVLAGTRPTA